MICSNCKKEGSHYIPPSFNETGFYICTQAGGPMSTREQADVKAEELYAQLRGFLADKKMYSSTGELAVSRDAVIALFAYALADARRAGLEEAAKMAEEKAERSIKGEHLNIPEYNFGYRGGLRGLADEIRLKLYAKAQAAQEENHG